MAEAGVCPSCEGDGAVGAGCRERVCAKRGYHFIPVAHAPRHGKAPDPMVGRKIDEYLVVRVLGAGGFGKVYLALQMPIMLQAALKLMHGQADSALARRLLDKFEGEARALATLTHPNIVRLLKYGLYEGSPYLVMEFVEGARTLKDEVAERARRGEGIERGEMRSVIGQVVDGLEAAHRRKLVHRDIKPENIMLQEVAGNPNFVKILDFGLAKDLAQGDETSIAMGTPTYMAPEQLTRKDIGPWTDWYAVGVMAFELITGRKPFAARTQDELLSLKLSPDYDPTTVLSDRNLPAPMLAFLRRAMARKTEDRYRTAQDFREAMGTAFESMDQDRTIALSVALTELIDPDSVRLPSPAPAAAPDGHDRATQFLGEGDPGDGADAAPTTALDEERRKLMQERARIEAEKRELEAERRRLSASQPDAAGNLQTTPVDRPERGGGGAGSRTGLIVGGAVVAVAAIAAVVALGGGGDDAAGRPASEAKAAAVSKDAPGKDAKAQATAAKAEADRKAAAETAAAADAADAAAKAAAKAKAERKAKEAAATKKAAAAVAAKAASVAIPEGMVRVAAGRYPVGCQEGDTRQCWDDEKPGHQVELAAFAIMKHEVTVGEYTKCVSAKACPKPASKKGCLYGRPGRARFPVNCVDWAGAEAYCKHRQARLPTEQEWEAAARGAEHPDFPWGDEAPTCERTVVAEGRKEGCGTGAPLPVGSMERDRSWVGALDLGGNVREWTASTFQAYPGGKVDQPGSGKVNRGASFVMKEDDATSSHARGVDAPEEQRIDLGFRCAADLK